MAADLITIASSVLPDDTRVAAFRGTESLSKPYEIEIFLILQGVELDLADAVGAKARLVLDRAKDNLPPFVFSGIFATIELLHESAGRSLVRAVLVPKLWLLGLSRHSRIFTKMSLPDILEAILEDNGLSGDDYELRLASYPKEEHVCQYRESDLAFVSRWMEREGIYYYFEHGEYGEKLVISDTSAYDEDPVEAPIRYHPQLGDDVTAGTSFQSFRARHATLPALVKLKDYDYAKPSLDVSGTAKVSDAGAGEVSLFGERFFSPGDGARLARLRAEELLARQVVFQGRCTRMHLRPGYVFELEDHPRESFNVRYLTIEARHSGNQAANHAGFAKLIDTSQRDTYLVEVDAIPATTQFRPQCVTPWPRIYGFENGIVDGPAESEYAQIDDQGRYSVKFKFDESDLKNGGASTFVRMMQPHGGGIEGFHFPLRKATEVVFSFLGGDPDRPVISGVVPNALTPSPVTSGNHTKNVIQTGGRNRLEIEDQNDQQRITLSTPYSNTYLRMGSPNDGHELIVSTDDNMYQDVGDHYNLTVGSDNGGSWTAEVATDWKTNIGAGMKLAVGYPVTFACDPTAPGLPSGVIDTLAKSHIKTRTETGDYTVDVDAGNMLVNVKTGFRTTQIKGADVLSIEGANWSVMALNGLVAHTAKGPYDIKVNDGNTKIDTTGTTDVKSTGNITIDSTGADVTIKTAAASIVLTKDGNIDQTANQKWFSQTYGDFFKFNFSMGVALTVGLTSETKIGLFNENLLGGKAELWYAAKVDLGLGIKIETEPTNIKSIPVDVKAGLAKIGQHATRIGQQALSLGQAALHLLM